MLSYPVTDQPIQKPKLSTHLAEGLRTFIEVGMSYAYRNHESDNGIGDGHPVLVIPGFLGGDFMTKALRGFLDRKGYRSETWDLGVNLGDTYTVMPYLENKIDELYNETGQQLTLIGWSLGGIYGRQLAKSKKEKVKRVITLCSPFKINDEPNYATDVISLIYKLKGIPEASPELLEDMPKPAPVPTSALYTKSDGIVPWEVCLETVDETHQNYEVDCGHIAVIYNKDAYRIILNILQGLPIEG